MSSSIRKSQPPPPMSSYTDESPIECSPTVCAKTCGGCIMFLISLTAISALGVIAGGSLMTAHALYGATSGKKKAVDTRFCIPKTINPKNGSSAAISVTTASMNIKINNNNYSYIIDVCP